MKRGRRIAALRPRHIFLCCAVILLFFGTIILSQNTKMEEVLDMQATLTAEYDALILEEDRLARMLEYAQTDEYKQQYAREVLGYIGPDDYKFYREDAPNE